jgi:polyisoprenyl-phosphate glycosyltransferase
MPEYTTVKRIDVILPVYKEEAVIEIFHRTLTETLRTLASRYSFHVIYVVDRSTDKSFEILRAIAAEEPNVTAIHMSRRFGHQMSLVAGLDRSTGDAAIMMDSDLQHPPSLIPVLLERFESGYDIVHTVREYGKNVSVFKRATSGLFYDIQNWLSPVELPPGVADFRLVSARVVQLFRTEIREHNQFLRGLFHWVGFRAAYVHFPSAPRAGGRTKYNIRQLLSFFSDGIVSFSRVPLRLATGIGLLMSALSGLYGLWLLVNFLFRGGFPPGYTSLILAMLFVGGLQMTLTGVIGEYIGHIFDEVKSRPIYVIDEMVGAAAQHDKISVQCL